MNTKLLRLLLVLACLTPALAFADCKYQGQNYPTGTKVGTLTCQPDGTWR